MLSQTPESTKILTGEAKVAFDKISEIGAKVQKAGRDPVLLCVALGLNKDELNERTFQSLSKSIKRLAHPDNYFVISKEFPNFKDMASPHFSAINEAIEIVEKWVKNGKPRGRFTLDSALGGNGFEEMRQDLSKAKNEKYLAAVEQYTQEISKMAIHDAELMYGDIDSAVLINRKEEAIKKLEREFRKGSSSNVDILVNQVLDESANQFVLGENPLRGRKGSEEERVWKMFIALKSNDQDRVVAISYEGNVSRIKSLDFDSKYNSFDPFDTQRYPRPNAEQIYKQAFLTRANELVLTHDITFRMYKWFYSSKRDYELTDIYPNFKKL